LEIFEDRTIVMMIIMELKGKVKGIDIPVTDHGEP
jgi:hypothetical protein